LFPFLLLASAAWVLNREFHTIRRDEVGRSIRAIEPLRALLAVALATFAYWVLSFYDVLALSYLQKRVAYRRILLTSFIASAFSHSIGVSVLSGGSVRYRMYSSWGLSAREVFRIIVFCAVTFWIGFFATAGTMSLLASTERVPAALSPAVFRSAGAAALLLVLGYLALAFRGRVVRLGGREAVPPALPIATGQVLVGIVEWLMMTSVLFALLPPGTVSYPTLLSLFLFAHMAGLVSQVPGGLGVFEWVMVNALEPELPASIVLGRIVLYRAIYYFGPLLLAVALMGISELTRRRRLIARLLRRGPRGVRDLEAQPGSR